MTTTTTTTTAWTNAEIRMFSACKDMFTTNPLTGALECKNDKESWDKLHRTILDIALGKTPATDHKCEFDRTNAATGLSQIITWPGGKKNELKRILANVPSYDRYFEPFVGGGSVFMGSNAKEHYINDFSTSLMNLYQSIATSDESFFHYLQEIDMSIEKAGNFSHKHQEELANIYEQFRTDVLDNAGMVKGVTAWCAANQEEILDIIGEFKSLPCILVNEVKGYLKRKFNFLKKTDECDINKIHNNIEHAIKGSLYKNFRRLFNDKSIEELNPSLHSALMVYIHQFCYRGMFKYDKDGNFATSFGVIGYLNKRLLPNLKLYKSKGFVEHFKNAHLYNSDFEEFLNKTNPQENDFIFLDPPYDEMFSEYDENEFNRGDHKRLANYLLNRCKSKWMMIINKTDFILDLYNQPGIYIQEYDKTYTCVVRDVVHLMITNYDVNEAKSTPCELVATKHGLAA